MKSVLKTVVLGLAVTIASIGQAQATGSVVAEDKQCCNRTQTGCDCYSGADGDCSSCREANGSGTTASTRGTSTAGGSSDGGSVDKGGSAGGKKIEKKK